ncbi:hypothetical protein RYX36_011865 [Vicia faba]
MQHQHRLLILYATQTGNALDAAKRLAREAEQRSCPNKLLSLHDYDPNLLPQEEAVIFVVSTTGQGDAPDSMKVFWRFLLQINRSNHWLKGVHYTVFGLGDSGYQKYNFVAKKLDKRLMDLGGTTILERGFGDDQHPSGYEGTLDPWMSSLWRMLNTIKPEFLPNGPDVVIQDTMLIDQPKVQITYHNIENIESHFSTASDFTSPDILQSARSMHPAGHEKKRLKDFASPEGRDDLYQYNQKERRTVLEVLEDFPSVQMPFEWLIQLVPLLKTRAFSISSSQSAHPNQVHLTVNVLSWTTPYKRKKKGLCSSWLATLDPCDAVSMPAWFQKGSLPTPSPSLPLILVGPGTGCAPFHGFIEERALQSKTNSTANQL